LNFALRVILFAGGPVASRGGIDGNTPLFPAPRAMPVAAKGERRRLVAALNAVATELGVKVVERDCTSKELTLLRSRIVRTQKVSPAQGPLRAVQPREVRRLHPDRTPPGGKNAATARLARVRDIWAQIAALVDSTKPPFRLHCTGCLFTWNHADWHEASTDALWASFEEWTEHFVDASGRASTGRCTYTWRTVLLDRFVRIPRVRP
jgi:hypothetical protein